MDTVRVLSNYTSSVLDGFPARTLPVGSITLAKPSIPVSELMTLFCAQDSRIAGIVSEDRHLVGFVDVVDLFTFGMGSYLDFVDDGEMVKKIVPFLKGFLDGTRSLSAADVMCTDSRLMVRSDHDPHEILFLMAKKRRYQLPVAGLQGEALGSITAEALLKHLSQQSTEMTVERKGIQHVA